MQHIDLTVPFKPTRTTLLLLLVVIVSYAGSLRNEYVFDDLMFIEGDPRVRSLDLAPRLFVEPLWGFGSDPRPHLHQYYRPLQTFPLAVFYAAFGTAAWPAHLLNLLLHLANALLAFAIFRRILARDGPAALCALLFAAHPGYSEAVLWVSNVAGLGATFCTLAIVRLHLSRHAGRWHGLLLTAVLCLAGLWFKESGVLPPLLIGVYDLLIAPDRGWRRVARMLPRYAAFAPSIGIYLALRMHALGGLLPGFGTIPLSRVDLLLNAVALLPHYVKTFLWPFDLNMYHDFNAVHGVKNAAFLSGIAVLVAAVTFAACFRKHPPLAFGAAWGLLTALPHLLVRWPELNVYAERYVYLPAVGVFLAVGYTWQRWEAKLPARLRRLAPAIVAVLLALGTVSIVRRTPDWHDDITLYEKTIAQSRRALLVRTNLAVAYLRAGRYDDGIRLIKQVQAVDPDWHDAWYNLGTLQLAKGNLDEALPAFENARAEDGRDPRVLLNLGYAYDRQGKREKAVETYLDLIGLYPRQKDAWYNLALIASELGQLKNARAALTRVLAIASNDKQASELLSRIAGKRSPSSPTNRTATHRRCAAALFEARHGRYPAALTRLKAAAWLDESSPLPHQYLANLYHQRGNVAAALRVQREALRRSPKNAFYRRNLKALTGELAARKSAPGKHNSGKHAR